MLLLQPGNVSLILDQRGGQTSGSVQLYLDNHYKFRQTVSLEQKFINETVAENSL